MRRSVANVSQKMLFTDFFGMGREEAVETSPRGLFSSGCCREELVIDYSGISKIMDVRCENGKEEYLAHFVGELHYLHVAAPITFSQHVISCTITYIS